MSYTKTTWRNNQSPAINADNLNHIEQGIYDAHDGLASANNNMELMDNRLQAEIDDANSDISTLESNLAAETSARTQQDSVLSARMDTFTQLPSGSTSGDAELIDIRVGADGTTYSTAGDAVRGQVSDLKSDLDSFGIESVKSANEFNNEWNPDGYISVSTGEVIYAQSYKYTDFVPIRSGISRTLYCRVNASGHNGQIILYRADESIITNTGVDNKEFAISDEVAFVRMYAEASFTGNIYLSTMSPSDSVDYSYATGYDLRADAMPTEFMTDAVISDNKFGGEWVSGGYINPSTNEIVYAPSYKYTPQYTELPSGTGRTVYIRRSMTSGQITFLKYDADYNILGAFALAEGSASMDFMIDNDAVYLRGYVETSFTGDLYISTVEPSGTVDYTYSTEEVIKASKIEHSDDIEKKLKVVNFGDSIYGNFQGTFGDDISVSALMANLSGYDVVNGGFGGCRMSEHPVSGWASFSMCSLADAIVSGDWSAQDASWANKDTLNLPYYFGTTIATLKAIDFSDVDIVTIAYGTNDWSGDSPIDNTSDLFDTTTFCGALRHTIRTLQTAYPSLKIVVQNPTPRVLLENGVVTENSDVTQNTLGKTLVEYIEAENAVCKSYKCPTIDAYYPSGFNIYNHEYYFNTPTDDVHLSLNGRYRLAEMMANGLHELY